MKALKKWFPLISLVAGVLALVMLFLPALKMDIMGVKENYNGLKVAFGNKDAGFGFSIMNLLPFVLAIVGGVLAFLGTKKGNKIFAYVAIACFVVAAVFFFMAVNFAQPSKEAIDMYGSKKLAKDMMEEILDLGIGSILAAIFSLLGAVAVVLDTFVVKE